MGAEDMPDKHVHNLGANFQMIYSSKTTILGFWGFNVVKVFVGLELLFLRISGRAVLNREWKKQNLPGYLNQGHSLFPRILFYMGGGEVKKKNRNSIYIFRKKTNPIQLIENDSVWPDIFHCYDLTIWRKTSLILLRNERLESFRIGKCQNTTLFYKVGKCQNLKASELEPDWIYFLW